MKSDYKLMNLVSLLFFLVGFISSSFALAQGNAASMRASEECRAAAERKYPKNPNGASSAYLTCLKSRGQMRETESGRVVQAWDPANPIVQQCEREFRNSGGNDAVDRCIRSRINKAPATQQAGGCQDDSQCGQMQVCAKTQSNKPGKCQAGQQTFKNVDIGGSFGISFCQQCVSSNSARCDFLAFNGQPRKFLGCSGTVDNNPAQQAAAQGADPMEPVIQQCKANTQQEFQNCSGRIDSAVQKCDTSKDSGMNQYMDSISEVSRQLGALTSANISAACSEAAAINQGAQLAVAGFRGQCKLNRDSCVSKCQETIKKFESCVTELGTKSGLIGLGYSNTDMLQRARTDQDYQVIRTGFTTCNKLESKIAEADQAVQQFAMTMANAKQCKNQTAGGASTYCSQNPTAAGCPGSADCSLAKNASTLACICSANPNDPKCSLRGKTNAGVNLNSGNEAAKNNARASDADLGLESPGFAGREKSPGGGAGGGSPVDQLGSANIGGGGSMGGGDDSGAGGEYIPEAMDVNAGYFGSGGGSGMGGSGSGFAGGSGATANDVNSGFYGMDPDGGTPNLADFLPNGERDPAMISGGSLPDGITGPTTNIWKKINFRYQAVEPTLLNQ